MKSTSVSLQAMLGFLVGAAFYGQVVCSADIAGSKDHPMLSRFPNTSIIAQEERDFEASYIPSKPATSKGFGGGEWVRGKFSWIVYRATSERSTLEIFRNYEAALTRTGFETTFSCKKEACGSKFISRMLKVRSRMTGQSEYWMPGTGRYIAARLPREGGDVWVSLLVHENSKKVAIVRQEVIETRPPRAIDFVTPYSEFFPGVKRIGNKVREYDEAKLAASKVKDGRLETVLELEGKVTWNAYRFPRSVAAIEVVLSYREALKDAGWEELSMCSLGGCGSNFIKKTVSLNGNLIGNSETWSRDSGFHLLAKKVDMGTTTHLSLLAYKHPKGATIGRFLSVSSKPLALDLISVTAESMADDIDKTGRVAVYGIYFDTDKAELKPESGPTLKEIARLLELRPDLALFIDGHSDDQGSENYNLDLSNRRASAVVTALVQNQGVTAERLQPRGFGEISPVETNETEAGRAKNRRVELVARD